MHLKFRKYPASCAVLLASSFPLFAQPAKGSIAGTVRNAASNGLTGTTVTARNCKTGAEASTTQTSNTGYYQFSLPAKIFYCIGFSASGFYPVQIKAVYVFPNAEVKVDETLPLIPPRKSEPVSDTQIAAGTLQGRVYDPVGKGMEQANVTFRNAATGTVDSTQTDKDGQYRYTLRGGTYLINFAINGCYPGDIKGVTLEPSQTITIDRTCVIQAGFPI